MGLITDQRLHTPPAPSGSSHQPCLYSHVMETDEGMLNVKGSVLLQHEVAVLSVAPIKSPALVGGWAGHPGRAGDVGVPRDGPQ